MGKPPAERSTVTLHFSHPHPLKKSYHQPQFDIAPFSCSCCRKSISGWIYSCDSCNYFLHLHCFERPKEITHAFHRDHVLTLLQDPAYDEKSFSCDACGGAGEGFSYHCKICFFDLHACCAAMPLNYVSPIHAHQLRLCMDPYGNGGNFQCDVCRAPGKNWLYRCDACEFDSHLNCTAAATQQGQTPALVSAPAPATATAPAPVHQPRVQVREIPMPGVAPPQPRPVMVAPQFLPASVQQAPTGVPVGYVNRPMNNSVILSHGNMLARPTFQSAAPPALSAVTPTTYVHTIAQPQMRPVQGHVSYGQTVAQPQMMSVPRQASYPRTVAPLQTQGQVSYAPTVAPPPNANNGNPSLASLAVQGLVTGAFEGIGQGIVSSFFNGGGGGGGGDGGGGGGGAGGDGAGVEYVEYSECDVTY